MISVEYAVLIAILTALACSVVSRHFGRQIGGSEMLRRLAETGQLRPVADTNALDDDDCFVGTEPSYDWYASHNGDYCVDFDIGTERQFSIVLKKDGTVGWAFHLNGEASHGSSIDSEEFQDAFMRWAQPVANIECTDDNGLLIADMKVRLIETSRGEIALVNEHGTPLLALKPKALMTFSAASELNHAALNSNTTPCNKE